MNKRERRLSDVLKRGYSDAEIDHIYELGRFHLENGNMASAEPLMQGITVVAPEYVPAWLGLCYIHLLQGNQDSAMNTARHALRLDQNSIEASLFLITCLLSIGDFTSAGALLGEVADRLERGEGSVNLKRYYRAQLARYERRR